jgi:type IV secretory pathway ATPase VirB11/archaellum biosynthesis ATPase
MLSGRPLDEANPVLDTDMVLDKVRARVAIIQEPLSPHGLAYAFRRHREDPWTLPLFVKNRMIDSFGAGLLSFLVDGSRTMLVAGTRSAGKTSFLGSLMLEILSKYRIIVTEDTLELPVDSLRKIGYDILRMKVRSALLNTKTEIPADEGIRTSLRLGDSCLIVGEVRSVEARALYEAMRVGALANVVAGTIHGASPYGVFDRVVNDLGVPVTSFKATDLVIVANPVRTADGLHSFRRIVGISEVRKHWTRDPLEEKGFVDLLKYNVNKDKLEITDELINGDSEIIKNVASGVRGWAGDWDAVYDNIVLRGKVKQEIVNLSDKMKKPELLEADFNFLANTAFHSISDRIREEVGVPEGKRVFPEFQDWLKKHGKKI